MQAGSPAPRAVGARLMPLLFVLCLAGGGLPGCAKGPAAPAPQAEDWYRKPDLFASFDAGARGLSLPNAYLLELACYIGDKGTFEVDRTLQAWGFDRRRDFRDLRTSTYGYVASNDRMVLVTFGGTDFMNVRDLLTDLDALQLVQDDRYGATPGARVHRGFRDSLNSVIDGVIAEVREQAAAPRAAARGAARRSEAVATRPTTRPATREATRAATRASTRPAGAGGGRGGAAPAKKLFVAGHSRGGAFAVLAAAALAQARAADESVPEIGGVYTFGQPRVGNGPFVEGFESMDVPLFRFIHRDDPIPAVPPAGLLPEPLTASGRMNQPHGYAHGGVAVHLREDGRVVRTLSDGPVSAVLKTPRAATAGIGNHYQDGYHRAIYAALANPQLVEEPAWRETVTPERVGVLPRAGG